MLSLFLSSKSKSPRSILANLPDNFLPHKLHFISLSPPYVLGSSPHLSFPLYLFVDFNNMVVISVYPSGYYFYVLDLTLPSCASLIFWVIFMQSIVWFSAIYCITSPKLPGTDHFHPATWSSPNNRPSLQIGRAHV